MSFLEFLLYVFLFILLIIIVYFAWQYFEENLCEKDNNDDDDIFFDNAPLPKSPSPLPPIQDTETLEQMQFKAFMKKMEEEKEKAVILRE